MNSPEEFIPPGEKVIERPLLHGVGSFPQGRMMQAGLENVPQEKEIFPQGVSSLL